MGPKPAKRSDITRHAIAVGNLPAGRKLELISDLDLGTVPWSLLPIKLKQLGLPLEDKGIDSLAPNLSMAVQAKDYTNGTVPYAELAKVDFMLRADRSPLKDKVQQMVVATVRPPSYLRTGRSTVGPSNGST